jgi:hypothetical protein
MTGKRLYVDSNYLVEVGSRYVRIYEAQGGTWMLVSRRHRGTGGQRIVDSYLPTLAGPMQVLAIRDIDRP